MPDPATQSPLIPAQHAALRYVREVALQDRPAALAVIAEHLAGSGAAYRTEEVIAAVAAHGRLTVNFHPDRLLPGGWTVAEALDREGVYRLCWHPGFELPVDGIDPEFRGPAIPLLAARVHAEFARPGEPVHAALIGRAAASVVREPARWADRGPAEVTLQHLKQLWHVLVRFGTPAGG